MKIVNSKHHREIVVSLIISYYDRHLKLFVDPFVIISKYYARSGTVKFRLPSFSVRLLVKEVNNNNNH